MDGYTFTRHDRLGKTGGGVGFYAHDDVKVKVLATSPGHYDRAPEFIIAELSFDRTKLLFSVVYRPPQTLPLTSFFITLDPFLPEYSHVVITGDLNIDLTRPSNHLARLESQVESHALHLVSKEPTFHRAREDGSFYDSCLDVFIVRPTHLVQGFHKSSAPFTPGGHDFISITYNLTVPPPPKKTVIVRKLKHVNRDTLHQQMRTTLPPPPPPLLPVNLDSLSPAPEAGITSRTLPDLSAPAYRQLTHTQLNTEVSVVTTAITSVFDILAPLTTVQIDPNQKPWITKSLLAQMHARDKMYKRARRTKSPLLYKQWQRMRNSTVSALNAAETNYVRSSVESQRDLSMKWKAIRKAGIIPQKSPSPLSLLSGPVLNQHYASISSQAPSLSDDTVEVIIATTYLPPRASTFDFVATDAGAVADILRSSTLSGIGTDQISATMLRMASPTLCPHLAYIANYSLVAGCFPDEWKRASIVPLAKSSKIESPSDTRPIAQLCTISKIVERTVHRQLLAFADRTNLFDPCQSAYRKGHSAQTALLGILEDVREAMDGRMLTILVSFDFTKAFDTVSHPKLLAKLRLLGCSDRVVRWFASYLTGRTQAVRHESGDHEDWLPTTAGVPQGSVLGPLLFLLFVNDLPTNLRYSKHAAYADDFQIYIHSTLKDLHLNISLLLQDAQSVSDWADQNDMLLNPGKTTITILGGRALRSRINNTNLPPFILGGKLVPYVDLIKTLGVYIDAGITWNRQISETSKRVNFSLYTLRKIAASLSRSTRVMLTRSLILPLFDYGAVLLTDIHKSHSDKLNRLHNACVRFAHGEVPYFARVAPFRRELAWLSARARREYLTTTLAFSIIQTGLPAHVSLRFLHDPGPEVLRRSPRRPRPSLLLPTAASTHYYYSFVNCSSTILNSHQDLLAPNISDDIFKTQLKRRLLAREE